MGLIQVRSSDYYDQVEQGVRAAIQANRYQPGDRLPSIRKMARQLDVSDIVVSRAVKRLSEAGEVIARRSTGIQVAQRNDQFWRASILFLYWSPYGFYFSHRNTTFINEMTNRGVRVLSLNYQMTEPARSLASVQATLDTQSISLAVLGGISEEVEAELEKKGIPQVQLYHRPYGKAQGTMIYDDRTALKGLASHISEQGIRTVDAISLHPSQAKQIEEVFSECGVSTRFHSPQGSRSGVILEGQGGSWVQHDAELTQEEEAPSPFLHP